jgi:hypothetical protein
MNDLLMVAFNIKNLFNRTPKSALVFQFSKDNKYTVKMVMESIKLNEVLIQANQSLQSFPVLMKEGNIFMLHNNGIEIIAKDNSQSFNIRYGKDLIIYDNNKPSNMIYFIYF